MVNVAARTLAQVKLRLERARARHSVVDIAVSTFKRHATDYGSFSAASLTYYTFFSIFPLLLFALSALGYATFLSDRLKAEIIDAGRAAVPMVGSILQEDVLEGLSHSAGTLALSGLLLGLYSGSGAVNALSHALNRIYRVPEEPGFFPQRLKSLKWLAAMALIALLSVALSSAAAVVGFDSASPNPVLSFLGGAFAVLAGIAVSTLLFLAAFKFLPARGFSLQEVFPGAVAAAIAFEVLKLAGGLYIRQGTETRLEIFGAFATAAGLLVACYLLSQVTLLAAEVNATLAERRTVRHGGEVEERDEEPAMSPAQGGE
ncbi:N/A [soil metagenome]